MDYFLTEDQIEMRDLARRIAIEKMQPVSEKYDEEGIFPWDIVEVMKQSDLFAILIPEEYDGISGKVMDLAVVTEELCAVDAGIALAFGATGLGMYPILISGSEEQKQKYLPIIASGEQLCAFALTAADARQQLHAGIEFTRLTHFNLWIEPRQSVLHIQTIIRVVIK